MAAPPPPHHDTSGAVVMRPRLVQMLTRHICRATSVVLVTTDRRRSQERIVLAREEERRRLHHRLHDGLGSELAASVMRMAAARALIGQDDDAAVAHLDEQIRLTRSLVHDIRRLVYDLRPPALDRLGLAEALRERAGQLSALDATSGVRVLVEQEGALNNLPAAVEVAAFWIGVEAVANAIRHAGATTCRVRLVRDAALSLEVRDDGHGLPDDLRSGGGLISMRERAGELGGACAVDRGEPAGTVVRVRLPIRGGRGG